MLTRRLDSMQRSYGAKTALAVFLAFFVFLIAPFAALASSGTPTMAGLGSVFGTVTLAQLIVRLVQVFLGIVGVLAVLLIMYGGWIWMSAAGEPTKIQKAKQIIYNAIIGLIIIFAAFAIASFIYGLLRGATGTDGAYIDSGTGSISDVGRSGIGAGPVDSVFPSPNSTNNPINTKIAVTFKQDIDPGSICATSTDAAGVAYCNGGTMKNVVICEKGTSTGCLVGAQFSSSTFANTKVYQATSTDFKTFVFYTPTNLGNEDNQVRPFLVTLQHGITVKRTGDSIFKPYRYDEYLWSFRTNGKIDLVPPEVAKAEIYPYPDLEADGYNYNAGNTSGLSLMTINSPKLESPLMVADYSRGSLEKKAYSGSPMSVQISQDGGAAVASGYAVSLNLTSGFSANSSDSSEEFKFTVGSGGDNVIFTNDDVKDILGVKFATTGSCASASRCLPISSGKIINTTAGFNISASSNFVPGSTWKFEVYPAVSGDYFTLANGDAKLNFLFASDAYSGTASITKQSKSADGKTAISTVYYLIPASNNNSEIATDTANILNKYGSGLVTANVSSTLSIKAIEIKPVSAGANAMQLINSADNPNVISGSLSGQKISTRIKRGNLDAYNNDTFNITFTKALNPIGIDGYVKVKIGGVEVHASTTLTNQYRTIELIGTIPCGINACGKTIYCWQNPTTVGGVETSASTTVEISAGILQNCASGDQTSADNLWCSKWGGTCSAGTFNGRCHFGSAGNYYFYPQVLPVSAAGGISDMSGNSLNGNFNSGTNPSGIVTGNAEGKSCPGGSCNTAGYSGNVYYNLTNHMTSSEAIKYRPTYAADNSTGDNFFWSFFVSTQIDKRSPMINNLWPTGDYALGSNIDDGDMPFRTPVKFGWNLLMRMTTLRPGWGYDDIVNSENWFIRYLALDTITKSANPVGYWAQSQNLDTNGDGLAEYTQSNILHNPFDQNVSYGPEGGSGVESVAQNCFLPGNGPQNAGDPSTSTSPSSLAPNNCRYLADSDQTIGCVSDTALRDRVVAGQPNSYAYMDCKEVVGAQECSSGQNSCKIPGTGTLSDNSTSSAWIITKDHKVTNASTGRTGCCLGRCR